MASPEPLMLVGSGGAACQATALIPGGAGEPFCPDGRAICVLIRLGGGMYVLACSRNCPAGTAE